MKFKTITELDIVTRKIVREITEIYEAENELLLKKNAKFLPTFRNHPMIVGMREILALENKIDKLQEEISNKKDKLNIARHSNISEKSITEMQEVLFKEKLHLKNTAGLHTKVKEYLICSDIKDLNDLIQKAVKELK
jgi:hypothetical protein